MDRDKDSRRRKRKDNVRKHARKKAERILARDGGACHWCRRPLVRLGSIPMEKRLEGTDRTVRWIGEDGRPCQGLAMTLDHVKPVAEYGGNDDANLVASCKGCNEARAKGEASWDKRQERFRQWPS